MQEKKGLELCLRCVVELEEAGYELEQIAEGKIVCENCGAKCWGRTFRVHGQARKAAAE